MAAEAGIVNIHAQIIFAVMPQSTFEYFFVHLFELLGANREDAESFADAIEKESQVLDQNRGVLFQFFDRADYRLLDQFAYASEHGGVPLAVSIPSPYVLGENPGGCSAIETSDEQLCDAESRF